MQLLTPSQKHRILIPAIITSCLIIMTSAAGILVPGTYKETPSWTVQSQGQDLVNLFIILPALVAGAFFSDKKHMGACVWAGASLYLIYTFAIYCFNVHFNRLFPAYCAILGLSFYSFLYYFSFIAASGWKPLYNQRTARVTAIYFYVISIGFMVLWLQDILPAVIHHTVPPTIIENGLFTNPVHVIDLSILLPGIFLTGFLIGKKHRLGYAFAPVLLVFFIGMDMTIGGLTILMYISGIATTFAVAWGMLILAMFSLLLFILYFRKGTTAHYQDPASTGFSSSYV